MLIIIGSGMPWGRGALELENPLASFSMHEHVVVLGDRPHVALGVVEDGRVLPHPRPVVVRFGGVPVPVEQVDVVTYGMVRHARQYAPTRPADGPAPAGVALARPRRTSFRKGGPGGESTSSPSTATTTTTRRSTPSPATPSRHGKPHDAVGRDRRQEAPARGRQGQPLHPQPHLRSGVEAGRARRVLPRPQPQGEASRSCSATSSRSASTPSTATATPACSSWTSRASAADLPPDPRRRHGAGAARRPAALLAAFRAFNRWLDDDWGFAYRTASSPRRCSRWSTPSSREDRQWSLDHDARFFVSCRPGHHRVGPVSPADPVYDPSGACSTRPACHRARRQRRYTRYLADWGEAPEFEAFRQNPFRAIVSWSESRTSSPTARPRSVPPLPEPAHGVDRDRLRLGVPPLRQAEEVVLADARAYPEDPLRRSAATCGCRPYYEDDLAGLATSSAPTGC